jgi:hypothetical protein
MDLKTIYKQEIRAFLNGAIIALKFKGEHDENVALQDAIIIVKQVYDVPLSRQALAEVIEELS